MTPQRVPLLCIAVMLLAAGCGTTDRDGSSASAPPAGASSATVNTALAEPVPGERTPAPVTHVPPANAQQTAPGAWRVTYGWAVPSSPALIRHNVQVPVVPPPGPPLPTLTKIEVGDHPADNYTRITFAFSHAWPSYELRYVPRVESEGTGAPIPLVGNAFLRISFEQAQAHDEHGNSTIKSAPSTRLGYPTMRSYGFAGDFEGYVTYGLGIQVPAGSDAVLPVRASELIRPDGSYVVAVDVRRG